MTSAVERLTKVGASHGIRKRGTPKKGSQDSLETPSKKGSQESLESPSKKAKTEAEPLESEKEAAKKEESAPLDLVQQAEEQLLLLAALKRQLETDLERTEEREVALLEAQLSQEAAKVKNTAEAKQFKTNLAELESLLHKARELQPQPPPPLPPPAEDPPAQLLENDAEQAKEELRKKKLFEETEHQLWGGESVFMMISEGMPREAAERVYAMQKREYYQQKKEREEKSKGLKAPESLQLQDSEALKKKAADKEKADRRYVVVAAEAATKLVKGRKGYIDQIKGDTAHVFPMLISEKPFDCPASWLANISELEAKTAPGNSKKQCTWIDQKLAQDISTSFLFKEGEKVPSRDCYELYSDQLDAGITEIVYRLLPGAGFVVVPASSAQFLTCFTEESHSKISHGDKPKPGEKQIGEAVEEKFGETKKLQEQLFQRVEKGKVVAIPIQAGSHWTLLVLLRKTTMQGSSSTSATNPLGAFDKKRRQQAEREQFDMVPWPTLPKIKEEEWEVRYYDTLKNPSLPNQAVAQKMLDLLGEEGFGIFQEPLLPVKNMYRQTGLTCGLWVLHYIEEEARCYSGEKRGTVEPDLQYRRERLNAMQEALLVRRVQKEQKEESQAML